MRHDLINLLTVVDEWLTSKGLNVNLPGQIRRVQIDYINQVDMAPADLLCGVVTDWTGQRSGPLQSQSPNLKATWYVEVDESEFNETVVRFDSDGQDGTILTIVSTTEKDAAENYSASLDRVHKRSYDTFLSITSDELQQKWGRKE